MTNDWGRFEPVDDMANCYNQHLGGIVTGEKWPRGGITFQFLKQLTHFGHEHAQ